MTTFDGWDAPFCGDALALPRGRVSGDYLMHFRTKGSKNGIRRYQNEDGSWTPLGMRLRKEREGWGETRKERKAEKRVQKAERKAARAAKASERIAAKRKASQNDISKLTDDELRKKIARVKMELEYKELTKNPILKAGEKAITSYMENRAKKSEREMAKAQLELDLKKTEADMVKARENTRRARQDFLKAKQERKTWQTKAKRNEQATALKNAKTAWKATTLHGGIIRRINAKLTSGVQEMYKSKRTARGQILANRILEKDKNRKAQQKLNQANDARKAARKKAEAERREQQHDWLIKGAASKLSYEARARGRELNRRLRGK